MSFGDLIELANSNPGALRICAQLSTILPTPMIVAEFKRSGVKDCLVWLVYKDMFGLDMTEDERMRKLTELIKTARLKEYIEEQLKVNERFAHEWNYYHKEVKDHSNVDGRSTTAV